MNVLIACEESQRVCIEFRKKGHDAFSCDIQECSGGHPEWHILGDVKTIVNGRCSFVLQNGERKSIDGEWDLIIAHPPCTYLSNAGACRMFRVIDGKRYVDYDRYQKMKAGREFFEMFLNCNCEKVVIENPLPMKICELPTPSQIIQPFDFGDPFSKKTLLWLKGVPPLFSTGLCKDHKTFLPSCTSRYSKGFGGGSGIAKEKKERSKTFPGIAAAMAEQWG